MKQNQNPLAGSETSAIMVWEEDNCETGVKYNTVVNAINFFYIHFRDYFINYLRNVGLACMCLRYFSPEHAVELLSGWRLDFSVLIEDFR